MEELIGGVLGLIFVVWLIGYVLDHYLWQLVGIASAAAIVVATVFAFQKHKEAEKRREQERAQEEEQRRNEEEQHRAQQRSVRQSLLSIVSNSRQVASTLAGLVSSAEASLNRAEQ